jgi:hypothetical protein
MKKGEGQGPRVWEGVDISSLLLQQNKKGEGEGKYVTFSTVIHKEVGKRLEMITHHVPLRQMID